MSFTLNWSITPASNGQWISVYGTNYVYAHPAVGNYTIVGTASDNQGTYLIQTSEGKFCPSGISQIEQSVNNAQWQVSSYFTPTNGTTVLVNSNIAQLPPSAPPVPITASIFPINILTTPDPINISTGEAYFSSTDFSLSARGPKLALFRKYRSLSTFKGMFGFGWRTDYDVNLTTDGSGDVIVYDGQGTGIYFMNNSGTYTPSPGNFSTLTKNADNSYTVTDKNGIVTHYDINGRLSTRTDRNGNILSFVFNPVQVGGTYIQDASGRQIKLFFDGNGHVISAQDPAGHMYQYGYDPNGNLVSIIAPTGAVTNYDYDSNHKIIQFTNANGHKTFYQYDSQGRAVMNTQDNNVNKITLNYQANNTTVVTDSLGNQNTYVFNDSGLMISHTDPLGAVTQQTWDANMNKTSITDARNNVTNFTYDTKGNLLQTTDALSNKTNMTYTSDFNLINSITDALGDVTGFVYDSKGNLTTMTDALGKKHSFTYDQFGNVITATDSLGHSTNFTYDAYGHELQKTDALGDKTIFTYDADGNILTKTDALSHTTGFQYDNLNRLLKTTFADGSTVSTVYDLFGNQISVTDQRGNTLTKTYDAFERLSQTKDPNGGITQFNYDTQDRLLTLTDANGHTTTYTYDPNGRVLSQTNALNFTTAFTYDKVGNVSTRTDANAKTTNYTYDALNRLTNTAYPDGSSVANVYDALGRKTSMTDSRGQTTYSYDALSRLLSKTDPGVNNTISHTYDSEGNRLTSIDQNNRTITNTYDALNRLISVQDTNGTTSYSYDSNSNRILVKSPNGVTESYTYDALNRVLTDVNKTASNRVISSFSNVYDVAGMITKKTFSDGSRTAYSYDALNRLLEETKKTGDSNVYDYVYTYDALGNRLSWTSNTTKESQPVSLVRSYIYDPANRLTSLNYVVKVNNLTFPKETTTYTYDRNGNRTFKQKVRTGHEDKPQQTTYSYDFENRLKQLDYVNVPGIRGTQHDVFSYSGDGLRTQISLNNIATAFLYDGTNVLVERDASNNTMKSYTRAVGSLGGIGGLIAQSFTPTSDGDRDRGEDRDETTVEFYQYNDLGSVSNLTTSKGRTARSYSYDAFGNLLNASDRDEDFRGEDERDRAEQGEVANRYLFSTKEFDSRGGLYYFGGRYYDPEIGRWLTPDQLGMVDGANIYAFVKNNPVNIIDPYGYFGIEGAIFGAGFGGYNGFITGLYRGGVKGAVVGLISGAGVGAAVGFVVPDSPLVGTLAGAAGSETANVISNYLQGQTTPQTGLFNNSTFSLASGALFGGAGSAIQIGLAAEGVFGASMASGLITTPYAIGADAVDYTFDPNGTSLDNSLANLTGFGAINWAGKERE